MSIYETIWRSDKTIRKELEKAESYQNLMCKDGKKKAPQYEGPIK